jgi:hypothetical protein
MAGAEGVWPAIPGLVKGVKGRSAGECAAHAHGGVEDGLDDFGNLLLVHFSLLWA